MKQLCDRMADVLGESLHTGSAVTDLSLLLKEYDKVISTLPAYVLSGLVDEPLRTCLQSIEYAPIAVVVLNFNEQVDVPQGFGYLVASNQEQPILGCVFRSEEHTSELQSLMRNSYAVF